MTSKYLFTFALVYFDNSNKRSDPQELELLSSTFRNGTEYLVHVIFQSDYPSRFSHIVRSGVALIDVCIGRDEDEANLLYDNFMSCKEAFRGMSLKA